jgi:hypothetical protein
MSLEDVFVRRRVSPWAGRFLVSFRLELRFYQGATENPPYKDIHLALAAVIEVVQLAVTDFEPLLLKRDVGLNNTGTSAYNRDEDQLSTESVSLISSIEACK